MEKRLSEIFGDKLVEKGVTLNRNVVAVCAVDGELFEQPLIDFEGKNIYEKLNSAFRETDCVVYIISQFGEEIYL